MSDQHSTRKAATSKDSKAANYIKPEKPRKPTDFIDYYPHLPG